MLPPVKGEPFVDQPECSLHRLCATRRAADRDARPEDMRLIGKIGTWVLRWSSADDGHRNKEFRRRRQIVEDQVIQLVFLSTTRGEWVLREACREASTFSSRNVTAHGPCSTAGLPPDHIGRGDQRRRT